MIIGLNIATKQLTFLELVSCLRNSKFKFFLTGSRYFGGYTTVSDWDFFVDSNVESLNFIKGLGFLPLDLSESEVIHNNHYEGLPNVTIYQLITADGETVQIQMLEGSNASNVKFTVQKGIKNLGATFVNLSKPERKKIWSSMLNIAWYYLPVIDNN